MKDIFEAIRHDDIETVKRLLVDPNEYYTRYQSNPNNSLLEFACLYDHIEIVEFLLYAGADPNRPCIVKGGLVMKEVTYPLLRACINQNIKMVELLLYAGANPNIHYGGRTLLYFVNWRQDADEIVDLLLRAGADPNIHLCEQQKSKLPDIKPELLENLEQKRIQWLESLPPGSKPWLLESVLTQPGRRTKACRG